MHFINLDDPAENAEFMTLPGGEPYAKVAPLTDDKVFVKACVRSWDDFGYLISLLDALWHQDKEIFLFLPYFPGARQDDNPDGLTPLSVDMYAAILSKYVRNIIIMDMHSPTGEAIVQKHIPHCHFLGPHDIPTSWLPPSTSVDYIIIGNEGAVRRGELMKQYKYPNATLIQCEPENDFNTGLIVKYKMPTFLGTLKPGLYMVVDDIFDDGVAFNMLADEWEKIVSPDSRLWLYATHGIFSRGIENISHTYQRIYTTDSWYCGIAENRPDRLKIIELTFVIAQYLKEYNK